MKAWPRRRPESWRGSNRPSSGRRPPRWRSMCPGQVGDSDGTGLAASSPRSQAWWPAAAIPPQGSLLKGYMESLAGHPVALQPDAECRRSWPGESLRADAADAGRQRVGARGCAALCRRADTGERSGACPGHRAPLARPSVDDVVRGDRQAGRGGNQQDLERSRSTPSLVRSRAANPFTQNARVEAGAGEIAQFFGPDGAISKFVSTMMGPLVVRRGDAGCPTWADMGVKLVPNSPTYGRTRERRCGMGGCLGGRPRLRRRCSRSSPCRLPASPSIRWRSMARSCATWMGRAGLGELRLAQSQGHTWCASPHRPSMASWSA